MEFKIVNISNIINAKEAMLEVAPPCGRFKALHTLLLPHTCS